MKTLPLVTLGLFVSSLAAPAQFNFNFAFNSGSTGIDGPLNVTSSTNMNLPTNGIFNFTTINVSTGATLRFNRNSNNTPVYLLASGDVRIDGTVDVSAEDIPTGNTRMGGRAGPGGFDGGDPGYNSLLPGDGHGPGGGKAGTFPVYTCGGQPAAAGSGAFGTSIKSGLLGSARHGSSYGSALLVPLIGGSGGGGANFDVFTPNPIGGPGGGGGGGAILIASSKRIRITGIIHANGGIGYAFAGGCSGLPGGISSFNHGSGGAIRLVAPIVEGSGELQASAPYSLYENFGRIRVDSIDRRQIQFTTIPSGQTGLYTIGTYMVTFPPSRLDIIEVGGTNIVEGSGPVAIQLANDSPTNRTVTVQARNFNSMVTNLVVLTPENGPRTVYTNIINNTGTNNPAIGTVTVGLPVNTIVTISAWTQ